MARLTEQEVREAFADLVQQDEVIVVYSGLWSFAHLLPWPQRETPERLLSLMLEVSGPDRTLVFPTYTFRYCQTRHFDVIKSPAETGILAQATVGNRCFVRSTRPICSYTAIGPKAQEICALPATTSWGDDGPMAWMYDKNARFVVLGVPWHRSCSYIHRSEEMFTVPYRFFKNFEGILSRNGVEVGPVRETMYVCYLPVKPLLDYATASEAISRLQSFRISPNTSFHGQSALGRGILDCTLDLLQDNALVFVCNREEVSMRISEGKVEEKLRALANLL